MRRFSVFRRKRSRVYYAQIKNLATGKYLPPKSTGQHDYSEALLVVAEWLKNGIPTGRARTRRPTREALTADAVLSGLREANLESSDVARALRILTDRGLIHDARSVVVGLAARPLLPFLEEFWNYDASEYVREKLAFGHSIGRRHCYEQTKRLHHWRAFFGDAAVHEVTRDRLREFQLTLRSTLAAKTANMVLSVGAVAFAWLADRGDLPENPAAGLRKFSGESATRGILSAEEARRVFLVPWADERARVANLVAMTTGARAGEVAALRVQDVGTDRLYIRHAWSFADGLKAPKNGETREAPLLPTVREALLELAETNPHDSKNFIFYHVEPDRPCDPETFRKGLARALSDAGIDVANRRVSFHSWRHWYAANLADRVDLRSVQLATGHRSGAMAEHYANHRNEAHFDRVAGAVSEVFGNVIEFRKGGTA